jgi:hypothetical protein
MFLKREIIDRRLHMLRLAILTCFVLVTTPGHAQIGAKELTFAGVNDCMKEAIGTSSVENSGPIIIFFCNTEKARTLYNFLGRKVRSEVVQDRNGKFENRQFGNNACYHRIEDSDGKAADDFRCDLLLTVGDVLNDQVEAK